MYIENTFFPKLQNLYRNNERLLEKFENYILKSQVTKCQH